MARMFVQLWPFTTIKIWQIAWKIAQVGWKRCQISNERSKYFAED